MTPSVWRPRPIPQPVEPLRTVDPPTPTLKELAERERQRASLVVADPVSAAGPKPQQSVTFKTCTDSGLAAQDSAAQLGGEIRKLQADWAPLTPDQRRARIQDMLNAHLAGADVPGIKLRDVTASDGTVGRLHAQAWPLNVSAYLLASPALTDADAILLAKTSYHEARHAEQRFLMARRRASLGADASAIEATGVRRDVARLAALNPLPAAQPTDAACAAAWDESYFGSGRAAREALYDQYPQPATNAARTAANETLRHARGSVEYARAYAAWQAADQHLQRLQNQYLSLPEENDAFATESLVERNWPPASPARSAPVAPSDR